MAKVKTFSAKQIARLADFGYWVNYWPQLNITRTQCIKDGSVKYNEFRPDSIYNGPGKYEWATLLWTCAATKNTVKDTEYEQTWEHFNTWEELITKHPELESFGKAPNDL